MKTTPRIGSRIRAIRTARELTQEELAERLGTSQGTVSRWELGGTITVEQLAQVAQVLEVDLTDLVAQVAA